jgi:hypothetical protein
MSRYTVDENPNDDHSIILRDLCTNVVKNIAYDRPVHFVILDSTQKYAIVACDDIYRVFVVDLHSMKKYRIGFKRCDAREPILCHKNWLFMKSKYVASVVHVPYGIEKSFIKTSFGMVEEI